MGNAESTKIRLKKKYIILDQKLRIVTRPWDNLSEVQFVLKEFSDLDLFDLPKIENKTNIWELLPKEKDPKNFPILAQQKNDLIILNGEDDYEILQDSLEDYDLYPLKKTDIPSSGSTEIDLSTILYKKTPKLIKEAISEKETNLQKGFSKIKTLLQTYGFTKYRTNTKSFIQKFTDFFSKTKNYLNPFFDRYLFLNPKAKFGITIGIYYSHNPLETSYFAKIIDARSKKELLNLFNDDGKDFWDYTEYTERFIRGEVFDFITEMLKWIKEQIIYFTKEKWGEGKQKIFEDLSEIYDPYREKALALLEKGELKDYIVTQLYDGLRSAAPPIEMLIPGEIDAHTHPYYGDYTVPRGYNYPSLADIDAFIDNVYEEEGEEFAIITPSTIIFLSYVGPKEIDKDGLNYLKLIADYLEDLNDENTTLTENPFDKMTLKGLFRVIQKIGFKVRIAPGPYRKQTEIKSEKEELTEAHNELKTLLKELKEEANDPKSDLGYFLKNKDRLLQEANLSFKDQLIKTKYEVIVEDLYARLNHLKELKEDLDKAISNIKFPQKRFIDIFFNRKQWVKYLQRLLEEDDYISEEIFQIERDLLQFLHTGKFASISNQLYQIIDQLYDA